MYPYKTNYNPRCNNICGIKNIGNNCYLNSGLQIIASCDELVYELNNSNNKGKFVHLLTDAIKSLLKNGIYDPTDFITYFSRYNSDFIRGSQCCSQNFIRTLIKNINHD
jgi:ubiquitin C-terminal hydrolase